MLMRVMQYISILIKELSISQTLSSSTKKVMILLQSTKKKVQLPLSQQITIIGVTTPK